MGMLKKLIILFFIQNSWGNHELLQKTIMDLTVQHFNSDHEKALDAHSKEYQFMKKALDKVYQALPEMKQILNRTSEMLSTNSLNYEEYFRIKQNPQAKSEYAHMKNLLKELVDSCPKSFKKTIRWKEVKIKGQKKSVETEIETQAFLASSKNSNELNCSSPMAIKLSKLGFHKIIITDRDFMQNKILNLKIKIQYGLHDMGHYLNQVKNDSLFSSISDLLSIRENGLTIGDGDYIKVSQTSGRANFTESFTMEISRGYGDCPSGCIYRDTYFAKLTPSYNSRHELDFKITTQKKQTPKPNINFPIFIDF